VLGRTDQDVHFWLDLLATAPPGRVLELACGTGRVTVPLVSAGCEIVGIDIDSVMLAAARARAAVGAARPGQPGPGRWPLLVAADMRQFGLACRFGAVIVPYNSIQLLTDPADVAACLACLKAHLAPGGVVGLEVTDFQRGAVETDVAHQPIHGGQLAGRPITLSGSLTHDLGTRTSRYHRRFSGPGWTVEDEVAIRSYRRDEVAAMLTSAGLRPDRWWEDGPVIRVVGVR
jgi:SAM-dependent methyltransferase